ncbi:MAG: glycosyltransferase family 2 protein [Candidatus Limnocylindrales bacterium]
MTRSSDHPDVSVLIPCWNAEESIEATLRSVLDERSVNLECVVVDDASTDSTAAVIERIAAADPRVVLIRLAENGGVSNARNVGLERVRGTWLTLVDADDRIVDGSLARLVSAAVSRQARAVVGQQVWTDGTREWVSRYYEQADIRLAGRTSIAARPGLLYYASPHGKLFARSCWEGLTFFGRVLGDQPWTIRAMLRAGDGIEVLDETVYRWRRPAPGQQGRSITSTSRSSARRSVEAVRVAVEAFLVVSAEAERSIEDPAARSRFIGTYAERLVRSDLGMYIRAALPRRDPTTAELFAAIDGFVGGLPRGILAGNRALLDSLLEPPLGAWMRLDRPARAAYRSLLMTVRIASPMVTGQSHSLIVRAALGMAARTADGRVGDALLWAPWIEVRLRDLRRKLPLPIRRSGRAMVRSVRRAVGAGSTRSA